MLAIADQYPLRFIVNGQDVTAEIQEGFTFSNTDPGGFEACSLPLAKDKPQLKRGDPIRIECGLSTAWEGRIKEVQRSLGAKTLIQGEGNRAILRENLLAEIFCDRDLSKWTGPSTARQIAIVGRGEAPSSPTVGFSGGGTPSLINSFQGAWAAGGLPEAEAWYDAHGVPIGVMFYAWEKGALVNPADEHWVWGAVLGEDEALASAMATATPNLRAAGPSSGYLTATHPNLLYAAVFLTYGIAAGTANAEYAIYWSKLAVYGKGFNAWLKAGAELVEGAIGPDPVGYLPSTIARFVAAECPGVQEGIIKPALQYTVPHAAYLTPVSREQIVDDMAKLAGWHWGVWESPTYLTGDQTPRLDFRAGAAEGEPTAWCWRKECEAVDIRENLESLYDSAKVSYSDTGGIERAVEVTLANPALEAVGLHRQVSLSLGTGTAASAEAWGLIQLRLLADQARMTGSAAITEPIHKMNGSLSPAWLLRSGLDRLRIPDLPCSDVWGAHNDLPITRVECSGTSAGLVTNVEFGNSINLVETLAAQLQANTTAARA